MKDESYEKIDDGIEHYYRSYDWFDDTSIIYGLGEKPASGSLSSDVIGIGIYDVKEKTHTEFTDIDTLSYKNHLTINPSTNMIALIEGAGREMIENKE